MISYQKQMKAMEEEERKEQELQSNEDTWCINPGLPVAYFHHVGPDRFQRSGALDCGKLRITRGKHKRSTVLWEYRWVGLGIEPAEEAMYFWLEIQGWRRHPYYQDDGSNNPEPIYLAH